MADMFIIISW